MSRVEKTVFISYRRTNVPWALAIYQNLTMHGYDVFFDYQSIDSGNFEKVILENIKTRAHFLVILTPSALERCKESGDWLRREIEIAMDENRNIIPLMLDSFDFGSPAVKDALTGKLASLNNYNGLRVYSEYFFEAMDKLRERYLNVVVSEIALTELNIEAQEITDTQKTAASDAPLVEKEQLTAQEWFERGYKLNDGSDEEIRCYTEAIRLYSNYGYAYVTRGLTYLSKDILEDAILDFNKAISILPNDELAYQGRAIARRRKGDLDGAITDYTEVIRLKPDDANAYRNRGLVQCDKGDLVSAITDYTEAIRLKPDDENAYYDRARMRRDKGDIEGAIADYTKSIQINSNNADYYFSRGIVLSTKEDNINALADLKKASELAPEDGNIRASLVRVLRSLGLIQEAEEQEKIARGIIQKENEYNQACFEAICGNVDNALEFLKVGLEKGQVSKDWARQDPDFENIRDDPRFKELVHK